jgi:hypothetical protein
MNKKLLVGFQYTANIGNYESVKIQAGLERDLKPDEKYDEAYNEEFENLSDLVLDKMDEMEEEIKNK